MSSSREVIVAAERYTAQGYALVAVKPDKHPLGVNWRRRFPLNEIIKRLRGPYCVAIGFLGGALNNHIVPLDFDTEAGEAWWRDRCNTAGIEPDDFPTVITPGKIRDGIRTPPGRHRYVTDIRKTLGNGQGDLKPLGIDVRGAGHAMLPPSPHPDGGTYYWVERHSLDDFNIIPACPDFIYEAIEVAKHVPENALAKLPQSNPFSDREIKYAAAALAAQTAKMARTSVGGRNEALNIVALKMGTMIAAGWIGHRVVEAALIDASEACGLLREDGEKACRATIKSGLEKGLQTPHEPLANDPKYQRQANGQKPFFAKLYPDPKITDQERIAYQEQKIQAANEIAKNSDDPVLVRADDLMQREYSPPKWAVPDLIPEGLSLLAGRPKAGKSWLALDFAIAVAGGTVAMGNVPCDPGPVLYLALEDTLRRLQNRLKAVLQGQPAPAALQVTTQWKLANEGGIEQLRKWLVNNREAKLVLIDTLQKIRGTRDRYAGIYEDDYRIVGEFKKLADEFTVPIVMLHHVNKIGNSDPLMAVSGTAGLTGSADTVLVLAREPKATTGTLYVRGRDVNEDEIALQFDEKTGKWLKLGKGDDFRISEARRLIVRTLIDLGPLFSNEIVLAIGKKSNNVRFLLHKMHKDGDLSKLPNGKYYVP